MPGLQIHGADFNCSSRGYAPPDPPWITEKEMKVAFTAALGKSRPESWGLLCLRSQDSI